MHRSVAHGSRFAVASLVAIWFLSFAVERARADDWPQWRGPNRNGISAETNWLVNWPPEEAWQKPLGRGYSSVAVMGDRLYTVGWDPVKSNDVVYCLDARTGTQIWSHAYYCSYDVVCVRDYQGPRATPTIDGTNVYTYSHDGQLYCFDAGSGTVIWSETHDTDRPWWGLSGSPLVDGDLVLLNAGNSGLAVNKHDGSEVWNSGGTTGHKDDAGYASPFAMTWNERHTVVVFSKSGLDGMDVATGEKLWWYPLTNDFNVADPVVYGDKIFISSKWAHEKALVKLGSDELEEVAYEIPMDCDWASPVLVGDYLYGFDYDDLTEKTVLTCADMRDGSVCWAADALPLFEGGLVAVGDKLIVLGDREDLSGGEGDLIVIGATPAGYDTQGRETVRIESGLGGDKWYTAPVLANGRIYCRSELGMLVCLRTGPPAADIDGNGMADNWERVHFSSTNGVPSGAGDDPDRDGADNRTEYVVGTIPTNGASYYGLGIAVSNAGVIVSYETRPAEGVGYEGWSRYYRLKQAATVWTSGWETVSGHADVPADGAVHAHTNAAPGPSGAYRVGVRLESQPDG